MYAHAMRGCRKGADGEKCRKTEKNAKPQESYGEQKVQVCPLILTKPYDSVIMADLSLYAVRSQNNYDCMV